MCATTLNGGMGIQIGKRHRLAAAAQLLSGLFRLLNHG